MVMWQTLRKCKLDHNCAQVGCVPKGTQIPQNPGVSGVGLVLGRHVALSIASV